MVGCYTEASLDFLRVRLHISVGSITDEIAACKSGYARLKARLQISSQRLLEKPNMSIPSACNSRAEMEVAYRFFGDPNVTPDEILNSHASASLARVKKSKIALLVQDTKEIDLTRSEPIVSGAGPRGYDKQLEASFHPMMAFEPSGVPLGTVWSKRWVRDSIHTELKPQEKLKARKRRPIEDKESFRWLEGVRAAREIAKASPDTLCVCIWDSEADIYELLAEPLETQSGQLHLLVRGCNDRVVNDPQFHKMLEVVRSRPVIQELQIDISKRTQERRICTKSRTLSRDARTASVSVQAASVMIARPNQNDSKVSELKINLVLVEETGAPEGEIPIRWYLLTTLPIDTVEAVSTVVEYYCTRWQIEIYFRTLKSGCKIEERYFERFTKLENCMAIYAIIAWRILYLCRLGEEYPDISCEIAFSPSEWKPIVKMVKRIEPIEPPSLSAMIKLVASLGGYMIRSKSKPGTQTLWLGLQSANNFATAWDAFGPDSQIASKNPT